MLTELIYYLAVFPDQEGGGHHRAKHVQNAEGRAFRTKSVGARRKFDYINRIVKRFRLQSMRVRRNTLPLVAMHLHDLACA